MNEPRELFSVLIVDRDRMIEPPQLPGLDLTWREAMALFEDEAGILAELHEDSPSLVWHQNGTRSS